MHMGHPLYQRTEEENVQVWFVGGSAENRQWLHYSTKEYRTYYSDTFLKEGGEKKSFQWVEFWVVYLVSYFVA